jgi:thioredoxin 1
MNLDELKRKLRSHPNPVIVDLWAPWCIPCRVSKPIMESLAKEYEGRVDFWAINADEHSQLIHELKIFGIPTVLVTATKSYQQIYRYAITKLQALFALTKLADG